MLFSIYNHQSSGFNTVVKALHIYITPIMIIMQGLLTYLPVSYRMTDWHAFSGQDSYETREI